MKAIRQKKRGFGLVVGVAAVLGGPLVLRAQDMGGNQLTYGVDSRIAGHSNINLSPGNPRDSVVSDTRLSFGWRTSTQVTWIGLDSSILLREKLAGDAKVKNGLINPSLKLSFGHEAANARIEGDASISETDLTGNDTLDDFDTTTGTRRDRGANLQATWGLDSRISWRLGTSARYSDFSGSSTSADRRTLSYNIGATLALNEALSLDLGLSRSDFREDGQPGEITNGLNAVLTFARPNGTFTFGLTGSDTPDGTRTALTFGRALELPAGNLSAQVGVTRLINGGTALTGALEYNHDLPRGHLTANLSRDVSSSAENNSEVEVTRASLGLSQDLTERSHFSADLGFAQQSYTSGTQPDIRRLHAGLDFSYDLGQDWRATAGLAHVQRRDVDGTATDNSVYIGLRRTFQRSY